MITTVLTTTALESSLRTPYLITTTIEGCLALACFILWLMARDFRVFLTLGAYCAMVGLQLSLALVDMPRGAQSALALTAPLILVFGCQAMRISMRIWMAAVSCLCAVIAVLVWFFHLPTWVAYLPANLTQVLLGVLVLIGFSRKDAITRWIAFAFLLTFISRSAISPELRALTHVPRYITLFGLQWNYGPTGSVLMSIFTLTIFAVRLLDDRRARHQFEAELEAAQAVQQMLLAGSATEVAGYQVETIYRAFGQVGGDFYQVLPVASGTLIVLGDVSGKGASAAITVGLITGVLRLAAESESSPAQLLTIINRALASRTQGFTTCLVLFITPTGEVTLANAGHIPPYLNGQELALDNNLPLGLTRQATYSESTLMLKPGDRLTLLTDGVPEAQNPAHELFGFDRTAAISSQSAEAIADTATAFGQTDDITVLTLTFAPVEVAYA